MSDVIERDAVDSPKRKLPAIIGLVALIVVAAVGLFFTTTTAADFIIGRGLGFPLHPFGFSFYDLPLPAFAAVFVLTIAWCLMVLTRPSVRFTPKEVFLGFAIIFAVLIAAWGDILGVTVDRYAIHPIVAACITVAALMSGMAVASGSAWKLFVRYAAFCGLVYGLGVAIIYSWAYAGGGP